MRPDRTPIFHPGDDAMLAADCAPKPAPAHLKDRERRAKDPTERQAKKDRDRGARAEAMAERAAEQAERAQGADLPAEVYGDWSGGVRPGVTPLPLDGDPEPSPPLQGAGWELHEDILPDSPRVARRKALQRVAEERGLVLDDADNPGRRGEGVSITITGEEWNRIRAAGELRREAEERGQQRGEFESGFGRLPAR